MWESRVLRRAFERLELHEGKLSRAVLRGGGGGDVTSLPDTWVGNHPGLPGPNCPDTELSRHRIVPLAKGEAGLGDYQVRNWIAWHHHQTLSLLAAWFLNKETRRGKKTDPRTNVSATTAVDRRANRLAHENEPDCYTLSSKHALA